MTTILSFYKVKSRILFDQTWGLNVVDEKRLTTETFWKCLKLQMFDDKMQAEWLRERKKKLSIPFYYKKLQLLYISEFVDVNKVK